MQYKMPSLLVVLVFCPLIVNIP